jgi:hypothetical protein
MRSDAIVVFFAAAAVAAVVVAEAVSDAESEALSAPVDITPASYRAPPQRTARKEM